MFDYSILNHYVDSYKLQIEILQLCKYSNNIEQKFLQSMSNNTFKLINIIESHVMLQNKYNESFVNLKHELESSLTKYHLNSCLSSSEKIYQNFQKLINNIEKTLKLTI